MQIYSTYFWENKDSLEMSCTNPLNGEDLNADVDHLGAYLPSSFVICFHKEVQPVGKTAVTMACWLLKTSFDNTPEEGYNSMDQWIESIDGLADSPGFEMEFTSREDKQINAAIELARFYLESSTVPEYDTTYQLPQNRGQ